MPCKGRLGSSRNSCRTRRRCRQKRAADAPPRLNLALCPPLLALVTSHPRPRRTRRPRVRSTDRSASSRQSSTGRVTHRAANRRDVGYGLSPSSYPSCPFAGLGIPKSTPPGRCLQDWNSSARPRVTARRWTQDPLCRTRSADFLPRCRVGRPSWTSG